MTNIGTLMRDEITRLSRRASKHDLASLRKMSAQQRRHIAALRREVSRLAQQVSALSRQMPKPVLPAAKPNGKTLRFAAKGLRAQRTRLGLSAGQLGRLVQVSDQTIYNWERGVTRPGREQLMRLAQMRALSKRDARARLEQLAVRSAKPRKAG